MHSLTKEDIFEMIESQEGRCYYCQIPMVFKPNNDWMCSLKRLEPSLGYITDNVALICTEFNTPDKTMATKYEIKGSCQWSKEKFGYFYDIKFSNA